MAIYMKFEGIEGQVTTAGFEKWIELQSMSFGASRSVTSGAGGAQREGSNPDISDIAIMKYFDKASAKLKQDALAGTYKSKVEIKLTSTASGKVDTFLAYELDKCGVSGYQMSSSGDNPTETLTLNFTKIMISPSPLDESGSPVAGDKVTYDLKALKTS